MIIDNKYNIGDTVYAVTDKEQSLRLVTHIRIFPGGGLIYTTSQGTGCTDFFDFELSYEVNELIKIQ